MSVSGYFRIAPYTILKQSPQQPKKNAHPRAAPLKTSQIFDLRKTTVGGRALFKRACRCVCAGTESSISSIKCFGQLSCLRKKKKKRYTTPIVLTPAYRPPTVGYARTVRPTHPDDVDLTHSHSGSLMARLRSLIAHLSPTPSGRRRPENV